MIEEPKEASINLEFLISKLEMIMPSYFARYFVKENFEPIRLNQSILIFIRISPDLEDKLLISFLQSINNQSQNYSSIKFVQANSNILLFQSINDLNPLISFLFSRDILQNYFKNNNLKIPLFSILIYYVENIILNINVNFEPYLNLNGINLNYFYKKLLNLPNGIIGIDNNFFNDFNKFKALNSNYIKENIEDLFIIQFNEFINLFTLFK